MPDLGSYAGAVLTAYGVSLALLAALIGWTWLRARQSRKALDALETRLKRKLNG